MVDKSPKNPMNGTIFANYSDRFGLYLGIASAKSERRDRFGRATPRSTLMQRQGDAILKADRAFFEAARTAALAEREAIAASFEQAGQGELATLVRGRPAIDEWTKP